MTGRALCIGIGSFAIPAGGAGLATRGVDEEPDLPEFPPLAYAESYTRALQMALTRAGYDAACVTEPGELSARALGDQVHAHIESGGVALVHVLSHGTVGPVGDVYAVGSDGARHPSTNLATWRRVVTDAEDGPMVLFLLDLCHAGAATRDWSPPEPDEREKAWVIAAASATEPAYAGRLTRAVTAVLDRIARGELDLDPSVRFVGFHELHRWIKNEVLDLARTEGGHVQTVRCTLTEGFAPELPFVPNPRFRPVPARALAAKVGPAAAPFLDPASDPVLDALHFRSRAEGHGPSAGRLEGGAFVGRAPELSRLSAWIDAPAFLGSGRATTGSATGHGARGLMVVRGSPGSGKSALLGVCVCAAHPDLRGETTTVWQVAASRPALNPDLVAVHARQRELNEITEAIGRQLLRSAGGTSPDPAASTPAAAPRDPLETVAAVTAHPTQPVIVLDALDEAPQPERLIDELLLPLIEATRPDGAPACRLLVGTRPWAEFGTLLDRAQHHGDVIDLDAIPLEQRRHDVGAYVAALLELRPDRAHADTAAARRAFADEVASALTAPIADDKPRDGGAGWGEFLVAGLYTHLVAEHRPEVLRGSEAARTAGASAPTTLPAVLRLDMDVRAPSVWRAPLLTALAYARGDGMPRRLLAAIAAADPPGAPPDIAALEAELAELRFYLRTGVDADGTTLYRLFHQGLADYLLTQSGSIGDDRPHHGAAQGAPVDAPPGARPPSAAGPAASGTPTVVFRALRSAVPLDGEVRRWDVTESYLRRHMIEHAVDAGELDDLLAEPGHLVHADPPRVFSALERAGRPSARVAAGVYRAALHQGRIPVTAEARRDLLAIAAARFGADDLRRALLDVPGLEPAALAVRWATGGQVGAGLRLTISDDARAVAVATVDDRQIAVTGGDDGAVRLWDLRSGAPIGAPWTGHRWSVRAVAVAELDGREVAVTGGSEGTVRLWDLRSGDPIGPPLSGEDASVEAIATAVLDGRPVAAVGRLDGTVRIWDLHERAPIGRPVVDRGVGVRALATTVLDGRPIVAIGGNDAAIRLRDVRTGARIGEPLGAPARQVHHRYPEDKHEYVWSVDAADLASGPVAVAAITYGVVGSEHAVKVWDLRTPAVDRPGLATGSRAVWHVAVATLDGVPLAVTGDVDGAVQLWDLRTGAPIGDALTGHSSPVRALTTFVLDGRLVAVTTSADATVRVWDVATSPPLRGPSPLGRPRAGHRQDVATVATAVLDGRPVAVTGGLDTVVRCWDLATGDPVGNPMTGHARTVTSLATAVLDGRAVAVSTGIDAKILVWDLATGDLLGPPISRSSLYVRLVTTAVLGGRPVVVTAGEDGTMHVTDLGTGANICGAAPGHPGWAPTVAVADLDDRPVVLVVGSDATAVQVRDLATGRSLDPLAGSAPVTTLAGTVLDGRPVAVTTDRDDMLRVWDLATRSPVVVTPAGHGIGVTALATGEVDGRPVAVTAGRDATVRLRDLGTGRELGRCPVPDTVRALALVDGLAVCGLGWDVIVLDVRGRMR